MVALLEKSPMDAVATIVVLIYVGMAMVAMGTLVGAVLLRAACWLHNKMVGGPDSPHLVPEPQFGRALTIALMTMLLNFGIGLVLGLAGVVSQEWQWLFSVISVPVSFLVVAATISDMLPTTFRTAVLLVLIEILIVIVLDLIVAIPVVLFFWFSTVR